MKTIDLEIWEPNPDDPRYMRYVGQPVAEEVFMELGQRLKENGSMPDEYFLMDREWENGRRIPHGADVFCTTDYGESEGVYVDVYLKWHEDGKPVIKSFATGKTLGESGYDLDKMFLTASAITKAFHGEGWHNEQAGTVLCLEPEEKKTLTEILTSMEQRPEFAGVMEKLGIPVKQEQAQAGPGMEMNL